MDESESARAATAPQPATARPPPPKRTLSLASELETMTQTGAFLRAIQENRPEVAVCRAILQKTPGRRSIDDIHALKSLLARSKLLEFFSNLDAYKIDKLYQSIDIVAFDEKGAIVFEQDDPGESFYMVFRGQVEIRQRDLLAADTASKKPPTVHIAFLHPGDSFGERALLYETDRRAASALVASDGAELIFINRHVFTDLLKESHEADVTGTTLEVSKRFRSNKDIIRNIFIRASAQRSEKDLKFAVEYLKSVKFFARFSFEVRKQLCKAMRLISAVTNTVLFEEGQEGRHFYIIFTGGVEVSVRTKNRFDETSDNVVSRLGEGEYFGELALSETGGLRRATVTCADFCELLVLGRDKYEPLIKKYQNEYHAQYAKMLSKNPYFIGPHWDDYTIQAMCAVMAEKYFPFKGEICRQGSRATEMFVVTRGECVVVHEGRHPVTGAPQPYELGRFGPNSVLGCAEASAGRFNDIYTRDYSILAESPVRLLVLSRFDIFHLMSATARESLQRSSVGYLRESIESRAIKSVAWERYRTAFLADVLTRRDKDAGLGAGRGPTRSLGKSASSPTLVNVERVLKPLVEPGTLVLEPRLGPAATTTRRQPTKTKALAATRGESRAKANSDQQPNALAKPTVSSGSPETAAADRRRNTVHTGGEITSPSNRSRRLRGRGELNPAREEEAGETADAPAKVVAPEDEEGRMRAEIAAKPVRGRRSSLMKSKTLALLETLNQQHAPFVALPQLFQEKPLYAAPSTPQTTGAAQTPVATPNTSERRRSVRLRSDAGLGIKASGALTSGNAIWNPVHGVCQPFAVVGFMRERVGAAATTATVVAKDARPHDRTTSASSTTSTSKASSSASSSVSPSLAALREAPSSSTDATVVTAFRVFGKFTELGDALALFRNVCSLETLPPSVDRDTSRFAVYKEEEITMTMENYFSSSSSDATATATAGGTRHQYRALDLPQGTGQRFACVSVSVEPPVRTVESVAVHVYQCFPTLQSAVRFARQMAAASLATMALAVVPLFEWVPLAEIERFDAKSGDLEQALESISLAAASNSAAPLSTCKARKEAVKKARLHALKPV